jgi:hypothetical protein
VIISSSFIFIKTNQCEVKLRIMVSIRKVPFQSGSWPCEAAVLFSFSHICLEFRYKMKFNNFQRQSKRHFSTQCRLRFWSGKINENINCVKDESGFSLLLRNVDITACLGRNGKFKILRTKGSLGSPQFPRKAERKTH